MNTCKITLANGEQLTGLYMSGNNFVSTVPLNEETFVGNLKEVIIETMYTDEETGESNTYTETHHNMKFTHTVGPTDEYYFILTEIPIEDLRYAQTRSDIEYLAMMTDTEL